MLLTWTGNAGLRPRSAAHHSMALQGHAAAAADAGTPLATYYDSPRARASERAPGALNSMW